MASSILLSLSLSNRLSFSTFSFSSPNLFLASSLSNETSSKVSRRRPIWFINSSFLAFPTSLILVNEAIASFNLLDSFCKSPIIFCASVFAFSIAFSFFCNSLTRRSHSISIPLSFTKASSFLI
uniref:Uncharacterized protein n=1 Tax=Cucumis sativus TaxID=3659 RepID=A0A0A0LFN3_CUCSA